MTGLLFLLEVLAVVLIALWVQGKERPSQDPRVTLFDMAGDDGPSAAATTREPAWRRTPLRTVPAPHSGPRPGWRKR